MQRLLKRFQDWYWRFLHGTFRFDSQVEILPIDFQKDPWWRIILQKRQKWLLMLTILSESTRQVFYALSPIILAWIFTQGLLRYLVIFCLSWALLVFVWNSIIKYYLIYSAQCMYSVSYNAHRFFLSVDPVYHTTRSSGKIISKITRASESFENFLDLITFDILKACIQFITITIVLFNYHSSLGIIATTSFFLLVLVSIGNKLLVSKSFEKYRIKDDDAMKAANLENLQSIQLIRSSFASIEQNKKLRLKHHRIMSTLTNLWMGHVLIDVSTRAMHVATIGALGVGIFHLMQQGDIALTTAIALMLTYINGSEDAAWIGKRLQALVEHMTKIQDLYSFVNKFGKQTYPVLEPSPSKSLSIQNHLNQEYIDIQLTNLHFDYGTKTQIFAGHGLHLEVPAVQKNKLYGIIGPSGTGKTTLLSIIGGQLRPTSGTVRINGIDVYKINDSARKELMALQMQTATNIRGELRYNLLLGLPGNIEPATVIDLAPDEEGYQEVMDLIEQERRQISQKQVYTDEELINILKKVDLWNIFQGKDGLDTLIGEGGLNLSGGQRQRLNFASLYLRSKYFQPEIILIDEPTSSLDEISEQAITRMIHELAEQAVTLVIAHRLRTLDESVGILDLSLIKKEKTLSFHTPQELHTHSEYYQKLMKGEVRLDESIN